MAYAIRISQSQPFLNETHLRAGRVQTSFASVSLKNTFFQSKVLSRRSCGRGRAKMPFKSVVVSATTAEKPKKRYPGETKGFVEEMRFVAMKLHTKDQAKEGEKEPEGKPIAKWEPSIEGYLRFLVDSKFVYDTLESIVQKAAYPSYAEFRNTGLERSEKLTKDLEWFKGQGHIIPEPSSPGVTEKILNNKELEFYKWDGELSVLLQNVRDKLNKVAESWSREEKNHCLEETEKSFKYSGEILRLILS
uniref:heme oxygenase (biliverdin-producing) n=1 Tax=Nelumbo nucifera TaxID=4432 RepID=A0A822ZJK4_NELNU|nr:TPA_asm: hypothetical protein HUJ06_003143 [Nelumbo nucifera]